MRSLITHALVFAFSVGVSLAIWSKGDKTEDSPEAVTVEVWAGTPDAVERVRFEAVDRTVTLEAKKDALGRYYVTTVDKTEAKPAKAPAHGHGHDHAEPEPDAAEPEAGPAKRTTTTFVGVKAADEFVQKLAPLSALRRVGTVEAGRAAEFGFDKPEGTLKVKIRGAEQTLLIGGTTPGGQERYAKHGATGVVYAVPGEIAQAMLGAETRLLERELHGFLPEEVTRLKITKGPRTRELVSMPDKKGAWADAAAPTRLDETAGNWMTKVSRLRVTEYVEKPAAPLSPETLVVRIESLSGTKSLGYLELYKLPGEKSAEYVLRTEYTRWPVKVLPSAGEQVEQDLPSVLK
jgi:hypothetical protein